MYVDINIVKFTLLIKVILNLMKREQGIGINITSTALLWKLTFIATVVEWLTFS